MRLQRTHVDRRRSFRSLALESLENRLVLSTIAWINRDDSDNGFNATFGGNAEMARQVVDAALFSWQRVIDDFDWPDNPDDETFEVEIVIDTGTSGCGAGTDTGSDDDGVPEDAVITLQNGTNCNGLSYWLDPTPNDSVEFRGPILNGFAMTATPSGPAVNGLDFFTLVAHELTHAIGISGDEDFLFEDLNDDDPPFTDTGQNDSAFSGLGTLWSYNGSSVKALFTDNNGGSNGSDTDEPLHTARAVAGNIVSSGNTYYGVDDIVNSTYINSIRYVPSRLITLVFDEIYPYDLTYPETFGTAYANFDPATGNLLLRGGDNNNVFFPTSPSDDTITLTRVGGQLRVDVDIGTPVPGAGSDTVLTSFFDFSAIQTIDIQTIPAGDPNVDIDSSGNDTFIFDFADGTVIPTGGINVAGGSDNDAIFVMGSAVPQNYNLDDGQIVVGSGTINYSGVETMRIVADPATTNNTFRVDDTPAALTDLLITGSNGDDIIDIEGLDAATVTQVNTLGGVDQVFFSFVSSDMDDIQGFVQVTADGTDDDLYLWDSSDGTPNTYVFTLGGPFADPAFLRNPALPTDLEVRYIGFELAELRAASDDDQIEVRDTPAGTQVDIHGEFGDDTILVDSNGQSAGGVVDGVDGLVTVDGGVGTNFLTFNDFSDSSGDHVTITEKSVGADPSDNFFGPDGSLRYEDIDELTLIASGVTDTIAVESVAAGAETFINANRGDDSIFISSTGGNDTGDVNGIVSPVIVDGAEGSDRLEIIDADSANPKHGTITSTHVGAQAGDTLFPADGLVQYSSITFLTLRGGDGGNAFDVRSTAVGTTTNVNAGLGTDDILVDSNAAAPGGTVNGIVSPLNVFGLAGGDRITLEDSDETLSTIATITSTQVGMGFQDNLFPAGGQFTYFDAGQLILNGGAMDNDIWVRSTAAGTTTTVNSGEGADEIFLDSNGPSSGGLANSMISPVIVNGKGDIDELLLQNVSGMTPQNLTVTDTQLGADPGDTYFGVGGHVTYSGLESIEAFGGNAGNNFFIRSTGAPLIVQAGTGNDRVRLDSNGTGVGGTVDLIVHPLQINSFGGSDQLLLDDLSDATGDTVHLTNNQIGASATDTLFGPGGIVTFFSISSTAIRFGNNQGDLVHVTPSTITEYLLLASQPTVPLGDALSVDTSGTTNPVHTPGVPGAGQFTFNAPHKLIAYGEFETVLHPNALPAVMDVRVNDGANALPPFSIPAGSGALQLQTVPVGHVDEITVVFTKQVGVAVGDLIVKGVNVLSYPTVAVSTAPGPLPGTMAATWKLATPIEADRVTISVPDTVMDAMGQRLDGEWDNPANLVDPSSDLFVSGNGVQGGDFDFRFTVLTGDVNRNNKVDRQDALDLALHFGATSGATWTDGDMNGDGAVGLADAALVKKYFLSVFTSPEPSAGNTGALVGGPSLSDPIDASASATDGRRIPAAKHRAGQPLAEANAAIRRVSPVDASDGASVARRVDAAITDFDARPARRHKIELPTGDKVDWLN